MKKLNSLLGNVVITVLVILGFSLASCDTCKHTSAYSSNTHNRMLYGHDNDEITLTSFSKTPYAPQKAKKVKSTPNRYAHHWWDN